WRPFASANVGGNGPYRQQASAGAGQDEAPRQQAEVLALCPRPFHPDGGSGGSGWQVSGRGGTGGRVGGPGESAGEEVPVWPGRGLLPWLLVAWWPAEVGAAAPPARLSLLQRLQWAQRNLLLQRAQSQANAGKIDEAIAAAQKALSLERALVGGVSGKGLL